MTGFTRKKGNKIHFLVVPCDLVRRFIMGEEVLGSVSDFCARHAKAAVIIPRLPDL